VLVKSTKAVAPNRRAKSVSGVTARRGRGVSRGTRGGRGGRGRRGGARLGAGRKPSSIRGGKTRGLRSWGSQMAARRANRKDIREEPQTSHLYSISSDESVREENENRSHRDSPLPIEQARPKNATISPPGRRRPTANPPVETLAMEQQRASAKLTSSAPRSNTAILPSGSRKSGATTSQPPLKRHPGRPSKDSLPLGLTSAAAAEKMG
jgi:hypothetical protein